MSLTILDKDYLNKTILGTSVPAEPSREIAAIMKSQSNSIVNEAFSLFKAHTTLSAVYEGMNGSVLELNDGTMLYQDYSQLAGDAGQGFTYESMVSIGANENTLHKVHQLNAKYGRFEYASSNPFFKCRTLEYVNASQLTAFEQYTFSGCWTLSEVKADNVQRIDAGAFFGCKALKKLSLPSIQLLKNGLFDADGALEELDLTRTTAVPTLTNANSFTALTTDYKIYVPEALLAQYKSAAQWSVIKDHIFAK